MNNNLYRSFLGLMSIYLNIVLTHISAPFKLFKFLFSKWTIVLEHSWFQRTNQPSNTKAICYAIKKNSSIYSSIIDKNSSIYSMGIKPIMLYHKNYYADGWIFVTTSIFFAFNHHKAVSWALNALFEILHLICRAFSNILLITDILLPYWTWY